MKIREFIMCGVVSFLFVIFVAVTLSGCTSGGGTETGTTGTVPIDTITFGANIGNVASSLVPDIKASEASASESILREISYMSSDDWAVYLESTNVTTLTDIFGAADEAPQVVTKIRVLVEDFQSIVEGIVNTDPDVNCTDKASLTEGDTFNIPFYGSISNGTSADRYFDCITEYEYDGSMSGESQTLYGLDSNGVMSVVYMQDAQGANSNDPSTQGNQVRNVSVIYAKYAQATADSQTNGYIDLQYAQASIYSGADDVFLTDDDVIFKSRSRITGKAEVDASGNAEVALGDFTVTKYDKGYGGTMTGAWTLITKSIGRGGYGNGDYSLFNIDSTSNSLLEDVAGIYCLQSSSTTLPSDAESENCEAFEDDYAWTTSTFPFTLTPAIEQDFESKEFFDGNDTDMIANNASNFTIPTYSSSPAEETSTEEEEISEESTE